MPKLYSNQKWLVETVESPANEKIPRLFDGNFSMVCTYHHEADISCTYGMFLPIKQRTVWSINIPPSLKPDIFAKHEPPRMTSFTNILQQLNSKSKSVLWMVSNCKKFRMNMVKNLQEHGLHVDIYGRCGKKDSCKTQECLISLFKKYKFYIAYENSRCSEYITEKPWKSLLYGTVPLVYGAPIDNYYSQLPPNSFLHVDNFTDTRKFVEYILKISKDNKTYLKYHEWRKNYTVIFGSELRYLKTCDKCKSIYDARNTGVFNKSEWWRSKHHCN